MPRPSAAVISDSRRVRARKVTTPAMMAPQETFLTSPERRSPTRSSFHDGLWDGVEWEVRAGWVVCVDWVRTAVDSLAGETVEAVDSGPGVDGVLFDIVQILFSSLGAASKELGRGSAGSKLIVRALSTLRGRRGGLPFAGSLPPNTSLPLVAGRAV